MCAALLLLFATAAQAQPFVGDEVIWRTASSAATYRPAAQAAPVASDGGGYIVAWSEVADGRSRACAGRLDAGGRLTAVGVCTSGAADAPAVAPLGDRYIAAWIEPELDGRPLLVTAALDRGFALVSAHPIGLTGGKPIVRTTATRAWVASGNVLYELDRDGVAVRAFNTAQTVEDLAVAGDETGYAFHTLTHVPPVCGFFRCSEPYDIFALSFTWLFRLTNGITFTRMTNDASPALATNGAEFLMVWSEPGTLEGAIVRSTIEQPFVISSRGPGVRWEAQAQIAWDGVRWVVVWSGAGAIEAAVITSDLAVTTFTVSARGARPAIAAGKPGRFLVTYEIADPEQRRLASRLIDFSPPPGRGRAVR